ncbi:alkaline shock response membrane anchor protein AmaP [Leptotrichia massiliensis]|uniref:alkaline shock response membrane anchor protein AmaP n=1 Tax=Leptotrichia massiliensis TaxID=1852388 RepID=UPI0028D8EEF1|nr:alkaline shock response membrane anchor protein AmaP [Leptotrichia massiliensis]
MIAILGFLAKLSVILGFIGIAFSSISDMLFKTDYLGQLDNFIDLNSLNFKILVGILSIIYLVIFLLSYINKLTKYSQNRKVKNKNGEIEVSIKTINETSKDFLSGLEIIKNSKVKSYPSGKAVVIEATVDTYNVDNLNEKLVDIQNKLSDYIFQATGITVKKSKVKLKKVLGETIIEKKIIDSPAVQKEENNNNENINLKNENEAQNETSPSGKEN